MRTCSKCKEEKDEDCFYPGTHSAKCKECHRAYQKARYAAHPEKWKEYEQRAREKDPEAFKIKSREAQARYRANPENTIRLRYVKSRYGIDIDEYVRMETAQGEVCAICKRPPMSNGRDTTPRLHVDHCHKTGRVRALLCFKCNAMLGHAEDSESTLQAAIEYLKLHSKE